MRLKILRNPWFDNTSVSKFNASQNSTQQALYTVRSEIIGSELN